MLLTYGWQLYESTQTQLHKWNEWMSERTNEQKNGWMNDTKRENFLQHQMVASRWAALQKMIESHLNVLRLNLAIHEMKNAIKFLITMPWIVCQCVCVSASFPFSIFHHLDLYPSTSCFFRL